MQTQLQRWSRCLVENEAEALGLTHWKPAHQNATGTLNYKRVCHSNREMEVTCCCATFGYVIGPSH